MRSLSLAALLCGLVTTPLEAFGQTCVSCWTERCPELASYTPPCEKAPPPTGPAKVTIRSTPSGLDAFVDGRPAGQTPVNALRLAPGHHMVRVQSRCAAAEERIEAKAGETRSLQMRPTPLTAKVLLVAKGGGPLDAEVTIDDVMFDATSTWADVPVCSRAIAARARTGERWRGTLSLRPGEQKRIETTLPPTRGAPPPATTGGTTRTPPATTTPTSPSTTPAPSSRLAAILTGCQAGDGQKCRVAGSMFLKGQDVVADKQKAAAYFEQGCGLNDAPSCTELGRMYTEGDGVPADRMRGQAIYERACKLGDRAGCDAYRRQTMTPRGLPPMPSGPSTWHSHWMLGGGINSTLVPTQPWQVFGAWVYDGVSEASTFFASVGYEQVAARHPDDGDVAWMHQINLSPVNFYLGTGIWRFGLGLDLVYGFGQQGSQRINAQGLRVGGSVGGGLSTNLGPVHVLALLRYKDSKGFQDPGIFLDVALGIEGL